MRYKKPHKCYKIVTETTKIFIANGSSLNPHLILARALSARGS
jgi:hypothetical protein